MKKQVLGTAVAIAFGALAALPTASMAAKPGQGSLVWQGIVPGSLLGTDLGLADPDGSPIQPSFLAIQEDGRFDSFPIDVRAFALNAEGDDIDPEQPYEGAIKWSLGGQDIMHAGDAYDVTKLEFTMNGEAYTFAGAGAPRTTVDTAAGAPDMSVTVSYTPGIGDNLEVSPFDPVRVTATIYAEGDGGSTSGSVSTL